jgi:hypothetical protein
MPEPERQLWVSTTFQVPLPCRCWSCQVRREADGLSQFLSKVITARHGEEADCAGAATRSEASTIKRPVRAAIVRFMGGL